MAAEQLEPLESGPKKTRPRVYYKNLHLFNTCMLAGSVATGEGGETECVIGAAVRLIKEGRGLAEQRTDDFGDFKFDGLKENSGGYELEVTHDGNSVSRTIASLPQSLSVGTLWI